MKPDLFSLFVLFGAAGLVAIGFGQFVFKRCRRWPRRRNTLRYMRRVCAAPAVAEPARPRLRVVGLSDGRADARDAGRDAGAAAVLAFAPDRRGGAATPGVGLDPNSCLATTSLRIPVKPFLVDYDGYDGGDIA